MRTIGEARVNKLNISETCGLKVVRPIGLAECAGRAEALELVKIYEINLARFVPRTDSVDSIRGGQRPITAASPFGILAMCDLVGGCM